MFAIALSVLLAALEPQAVTPQTGPSPSAAVSPPVDDPQIAARVKAEFVAWQQGAIDRSLYSPAFGDPTDMVEAMSAQLKGLGPLLSTTARSSLRRQGSTIYVYSLRCRNGNVKMQLGLDARGKISAISFEPVAPPA
jgi:hypothetical protein